MRFREKLVLRCAELRLPHKKDVTFAESLENQLKMFADDSVLSRESCFWRTKGLPPQANLWAAGATDAPGAQSDAPPALPVASSIDRGQLAAATRQPPPPEPFYAAMPCLRSSRCRVALLSSSSLPAPLPFVDVATVVAAQGAIRWLLASCAPSDADTATLFCTLGGGSGSGVGAPA